MEYLPSPQADRPHLLGYSQVALTDEDMKHVETMVEEEELNGVMDFMDARHIPYEGLNSVEEFKTRIYMEYWRQRRASHKETIGQAICESGENDSKKRDRLTDMLKQLKDIVTIKDETKKQEMVAHFLETEGTTADLEGDCTERITNLEGKECVILVAGETSAGKSSVLNLLFGEKDLLPTHAKSCTATITTIRYGKQRRVRVIYRYKDPYEINKLDDDGIKEFHDIVFMSKERDEHDIKEVQVFLPLWFLKSGLVLADTPGIGENEFLEKYLMDYIEHSQILGFMYIIMSDHCGGVQEDRLMLLLKMIIDQQKKNKNGLKFDPKAALFICNRFDAIPEKDRPAVEERIYEQLGKCWPEFDESNVVCMSTLNAMRDVEAHPDYINDDFKAQLEGLKKLYGTALDRRIRSSYKWMENVLKRIMHFLKSIVKRLDMIEKERHIRLMRSRDKLKKLLTQSEQVIAGLRVEVEEAVEVVCEEVRKYIQKHSVQMRLTALWRSDEIPVIDEDTDITSAEKWVWLKGRIDVAFYDRLCGILEEWDNDDCRISEIEEKVIEDIKMKLGVLEHEIFDVENDLSGSTSSTESKQPIGASSRRFTLTGPKCTIETDQVKLPMKLNMRLPKPSKPLSVLVNSRMRSFRKNPQKMAKARAEKLFNRLLDKKSKYGDLLKDLVTQLFQRPLEWLDKLEERIPSIIKANENLLNDIEVLNVTEKQHLAKYVSMVEDIDALRKHLMSYGEGYIFVHDFKSDEVKLLHETASGSISKTYRDVEAIVNNSLNESDSGVLSSPRGLWTIFSPGIVVRGNGDEPVTIRVYLHSSAMDNTFQEVAKLRCLVRTEAHLAEFLGIHHVDAAAPAFIYSGRLQSVSHFIRKCPEPSQHFRRILTQVATAINYIHSKGLVHMELTKNSLTVDERGEVRVTGACLPRKATLPIDTNMAVSEFVYLAPEVLNGELYLATADLYGYGIFLLELVTQKTMFKHEKKTMSFQEFQQKVDNDGAERMLLKGFTSLSLTEDAIRLVKKCLNKGIGSFAFEAEVGDIKDFRRKAFGETTPRQILGASLLREKQL